MIDNFSFLSGAGCCLTLWCGFRMLHELVRHKSMLEYQFPNIEAADSIRVIIGIIMWGVGGYFA